MAIEVSPEIQAMVENDVARGAYRSVTEFVEEAVQLLHEREEARARISSLIEEGWACASPRSEAT